MLNRTFDFLTTTVYLQCLEPICEYVIAIEPLMLCYSVTRITPNGTNYALYRDVWDYPLELNRVNLESRLRNILAEKVTRSAGPVDLYYSRMMLIGKHTDYRTTLCLSHSPYNEDKVELSALVSTGLARISTEPLNPADRENVTHSELVDAMLTVYAKDLIQ